MIKVWTCLQCWWRWFALITLDSSTRHTSLNLSWESNCIHKHSCKRIKEKTLENFENKQLTLATEKQFLTVPKLCEFGHIRKFRSRASICKKNQLNRSDKTQVMIKRSFEYESEQNSKLENFKKLMWQVHWIGENKTKL